jgi:putative spermidine/putrescine transport system ATP-binding protein
MASVKLRIDGVRKMYGSVAALHETSLDVLEGEFVTLLGPSGSGKTTLLHSVAGLLEPDGGRIWIDGVDATYLAPHRRDLGMVFQNYALFPHLTVFENIAFPLRMRGCPARETRERVHAALALVRLADVEARLPRELSGGQQQRIALARCVVYRPSIVLMDEPLGALDKKLREQMQLEIKRIHGELGVTVLYVTHDQEEAMTMSDRICLMRSGRIEQIGTPRNLYLEPASVYAADFLGESNLLPGQYQGNGAIEISGDASSLRIVCRVSDNIAIGHPVRCLIRPEAVRILGPGDRADNEIAVTIRDVTLAGGVTRYVLGLVGGTEMRATVLSAGSAARHPVGTSLRVGIDRDDARVLNDEVVAG